MPPTSLQPPALLRQAAAERTIAFMAREADLSGRIRHQYRARLLTYRTELEAFFFQQYGANVDPTSKEAVWDPASAILTGLLDEWSAIFDDTVDAATDPVEEMLDTELVDGYDESYDRALWLLYLGGIDSLDADDPGGFDATKAALLVAGVGGIGYAGRLQAWSAEVKSRFRGQFKAMVVGGRTGRETLDTFDALATTYVGRVEGLGQNELHRAAGLGAAAAVAPYQSELEGEVWLTMRDGGVCDICREKELTITVEQPITHSHPGCRCWKIPIPLDYRGQPIDYVAFLMKLGRR